MQKIYVKTKCAQDKIQLSILNSSRENHFSPIALRLDRKVSSFATKNLVNEVQNLVSVFVCVCI